MDVLRQTKRDGIQLLRGTSTARVLVAIVRHTGGEVMRAPLRIFYRADREAEMRAMLAKTGMEVVDGG